MKAPNSFVCIGLAILSLFFGVSGAWAQPDVEDRLQAMADEIARLREQMAIPETQDHLESLHGMGPAASKVYQARQGVSLGGYGEFYYASPRESGAVSTGDFFRFISYFGYKFTDAIVMNTEIEFEHATTSSNHAGSGGSVSVEFSYLDFLLSERANVRAGNLLVPMGIVNELHEPAFYRGNFRPDVERSIIPSTWRELGVGLHGKVEGVRYTAYLLNGLNAAKFNDEGVRGGRQKGNRVLFEDVAGVLALSYDQGDVEVGGSAYAGGADHSSLTNDDGELLDVSNTILEAHVQIRKGPVEARALVARGHIDGAAELSPVRFPDADALVPEDQLGFYVEAAVDVAPWVLGADTTVQVAPWIRFEDVNLHDAVPVIDGLGANPALATQSFTVGLDVKPHPNTVLKLDVVRASHDGDDSSTTEIRVGAGFVY